MTEITVTSSPLSNIVLQHLLEVVLEDNFVAIPPRQGKWYHAYSTHKLAFYLLSIAMRFCGLCKVRHGFVGN